MLRIGIDREKCSDGRDDLIGDYLRAIDRELTSLEQPRELDTNYY